MAKLKLHRFTVRNTTFVNSVMNIPFDMMRYDSCWPATQQDASDLSLLASSHCLPVDKMLIKSVTLASHKAPTIARWQSFGFTVVELPTITL